MIERPKSQTAIIDAAFDVLGRNASAPISEVATAAGVGRATLHRHFPSREDLMRALAQVAMDDLNAAVTAAIPAATSYLEGLQLAMRATVPLANRQLFLLTQPLPHDPEIAKAHAASAKETRDTIDAAKSEGNLPDTMPTAWVARVYNSLIYTAWEAVAAQELTPNQASDMAWRTFLAGVKGDHA